MADKDQNVPEMVAGVDVTAMALSVEEGFVFSRIDGRSDVSALSKVIGKPKDETERILVGLAQKGVIRYGDIKAKTHKPTPAPARGGSPAYGLFVFPANMMMEDCDLNEDERKRIIYNNHHLSTWSHYELLSVPHKADSKAIKKQYFALSKDWHPDRWRRSNLGSFKKMIETIYKQVIEANRVLSNPEKRKEYDSTIVFEFDEEDIERLMEAKKEEKRAARHQARLREKRKRSNPIRKRLGQAKKFYEQALELEAQNRVMDALRAAQMALTYDDKREAYQELVKRLTDLAGEHKIGPFIKRGKSKEALTEWEDAIEMFDRAVQLAPNNGEARLRLAYNMLMGGKPAHEAMKHAQKAASMMPQEPEVHFVLGRLYEETGLEKLAKTAYQKAIDLKPNYQDVKKRLKRLKWGF